MNAERNSRVAQLLNDPRLWTAQDLASVATIPTGHRTLDEALPGGGWPRGAITELLCERAGIGELALLAPALAQLCAQHQRLALVNPPYRACGPAWAQAHIRLEQLLLVEAPRATDGLWAAEQILRSGAFGAVLSWSGAPAEKELRRLQLAAAQGGSMLFLFRPLAAARHSSPAALRLRLARGLRIDILKSRGGRPRALVLPLTNQVHTASVTCRSEIKRSRAEPGEPFAEASHRPGGLSNSDVVAMPLPAAPAARCAG